MDASESDAFALMVGGDRVSLRSNDVDLHKWLGVTFADLDERLHEDLAIDLTGASASSAATLGHDSKVHRVEIDVTADGASLVIGGEVGYSSVNVSRVIDHFVAWCNRLAIESRPGHVNLHAAGLEQPGRAGCVLVPGAPGAGKSSVSCAALAAGWSYLSDELVSIDRAGVAHPYRKPVTLKQGTKELLPLDYGPVTLSERQMRWYLTAGALGGALAAPSQPRALVFCRYEPDSPTTAEPMSAAAATVELAANCQDELSADGNTLLLLANVTAGAPAVRMTQRDLGEAVAVLADIDAGAGHSVSLDDHPRLLGRLESVPRVVGPRIADRVTAVALADGVVVHHHDTGALVALDPLAGVIWQLLDGSTPQDSLALELAEVFDHPADRVAADLQALMERLAEHDLLAT